MRLRSRLLASALLPGLSGCITPPPPALPSIAVGTVPTAYVGDRFYVRPVTTAGDTMTFLTSTAATGCTLYRWAVDRFGLAVMLAPVAADSVFVAPWPQFRPGAAIPPCPGMPDGRAGLVVAPRPVEAVTPAAAGDAGVLGLRWFGGRVWRLDYPRQRMYLLDRLPSHTPEQTLSLNLAPGRAGAPDPLPSLRVTVDGDTLALLLDVGATMALSAAGRERFGVASETRQPASFVTRRWIDRWHARHPEWAIAERAERGTEARMIEVPHVGIASHIVGPVWFTERSDDLFRAAPAAPGLVLDGAAGGTLLRELVLTLDFAHGIAVVER